MDKILTVGRKSHHSLLSKQLFIARTSDTRGPTFDSENAANQFSLISCARGRLISVPKRVDKCINENKITKKGELWNHSE